MALTKCHECGRDVSDQAKACPNCGAPIGGPVSGAKQGESAQPAATSSSPARILKLFAVAILLILAVLLSLPWLRKAGIIPTPAFAVDNVGGSEACTILGDYCLRVQCAVTNTGSGQGSVRIIAEIVPDTGSSTSHEATRVVAAGQREVVSLDFPEAELGRTYTYRCSGAPVP
jgi:hypothetical protein